MTEKTPDETGFFELPAYDKSDLRWAINVSAFLGWLGVCFPYLIVRPNFLLLFASVGLPIAFFTCWLVAAPILRRLIRRPITWLSAGFWGGVIAAIIYSIYRAILLFLGWRLSQKQNYKSQIGSGEFIESKNGILTPYGWWVVAQSAILFILLGVAIALIVRWRVGPGRYPAQG